MKVVLWIAIWLYATVALWLYSVHVRAQVAATEAAQTQVLVLHKALKLGEREREIESL